VDHDFRDETKEVARVPGRVLSNGRGDELLMTTTLPPGVTDDFFDRLLAPVDTELATLRKLLESAG
jgi:hypothetical protein